MGSFRSVALFLILLAGISCFTGHLQTTQTQILPNVCVREEAVAAQLKEKGENLLRQAVTGPVSLTVTVRCGQGTRKQSWQIYPGGGNRFGYAVVGLQEKSEKYSKDASNVQMTGEDESSSQPEQKSGYKDDVRSEKRDYSQLKQENQEYQWIERISACAVVSEGDRQELETALSAALGLDSVRGDAVCVIVKSH